MSTYRNVAPDPTLLQPKGFVQEADSVPDAPPVAIRSMPTGGWGRRPFRFDLLRALQLHGGLAVTIFLAGVAATAAYVVTTWPVFDSECLVYFPAGAARSMAAQEAQNSSHDGSPEQSTAALEWADPTRSDVLRAALHKLPPGTWQHEGESEDAAIARLEQTLTVERTDVDQISIQASASQPDLAADIANAVSASFAETATKERKPSDPQWAPLVADELDRIRKALTEDRAELDQLNRIQAMASQIGKSAQPSDERINALGIELTKARAAHDEAAARLTALAADSTSGATIDAETDELIAADSSLETRSASLNQRRAQLISEMATFPSNDPQYQRDADELAQIVASLEKLREDLRARAVDSVAPRLQSDLERTAAAEAKLNTQLAGMIESEGSTASRQKRAGDLSIDMERLQNRYRQTEDLYRKLSLETRANGETYVSRPALPPLHPSVLHLLRDLAFLLLGSAVVALGSAVVVLNLDQRVYIATDIECVLGFSPMAQLPHFQQVSADVGEEYLGRLAAAVEYVFHQTGFKSCLITGVTPGADASTIASRMTTTLKAMGRSTILMNAAATPAPSRESLLQQIAEHEDSETIIFADTAPLVTSGETQYLARFVDFAIVVIQSGLTTRDQLREVAQVLERLDVSAVGYVLNRVSIPKANAAFRKSIRAVEQRVAVGDRLGTQNLRRTWPSTQHPRESAHEPPVVTEPELVKKLDNNSTPDSSLPPDALDQPQAAAPIAGAAIAELETASPRRIARGRGEPAKSASSSRTARSAASRAGSAAAMKPAAEEVAGTTAAISANPAARSRPTPRPEPAQVPSVPAIEPVAGRTAERIPPLPSAPAQPGNQAAPEDRSSQADDDYVAPSRLSGLRNLLVTLGRRSLEKEGHATGESHSDIEPRFERATVRHASPETPLPEGDAPDHAKPAALKAQPEFIRPKLAPQPGEEDAEKEKEVKLRPTPQRRDKPDPEEIQTLPSWRGQYRKKRYPPL